MIEHRDKIRYALYGIVCIAFVVSYAITNIAIFLLFALFFIDKKNKIKSKLEFIKNNRLIWLYLCFFCAQLIGLLYSENLNEGYRRVTVLLPISFLPAIIMAEKINAAYFKKLQSFLQIAIPMIFIFLILIHLLYDKRAMSTFVHFTANEKLGVSQFYLVFILLIPFKVSYINLKNNTSKIINGSLLALSLALILVMGNKTTIVLLFIIALGLLVRHIKNIKKAILFIVSMCVLGFTSYNLPIVNERFGILLKTTDFDVKTVITKNNFTITKNTLEHRFLINYLSFGEIIEALPFGVGTGDVQDILDEKYKAINFKAAILGQFNNHNQYFSEFFKTGFLGGILFIILLFGINRKAVLSNGFALPFTALFTISCFMESYLYRQHGVIIFAFLIPLFLNHRIDVTKEY
ncbi:O-antigen ligase family protein [Winogradskyella flava]|uniref:O-antigen ligase family protein n=1 Tax=Winogradskyella flava TaxID=1884876 RepID=UPI00248FF38F|nr:O-antigen ligase family protein [Winogradskyella flava]